MGSLANRPRGAWMPNDPGLRRLVVNTAATLAVSAVMLSPGLAAAERVVFVNLEPLEITDTEGHLPTANSFTSAGFVAGPVSGWALTPAQQTELHHWLKEATVPLDIVYTFERPAAGDYDMVVFGTAADNAARFPDTGCSAAISLADCSDERGHNINFLFHGCLPDDQQDDMKRVAFNTLVGAGFGWGLENEDSAGQIMGSYSLFGLEFGNTCVPIAAGTCADHALCPPGEQNARSDLTTLIGARVDDGPPSLAIVSPADQEVVASDFQVSADVSDKFGALDVLLEVVEAKQQLGKELPPYSWDLSGVPEGQWTLRVSAIDADANEVSQDVVVCVGSLGCGQVPAADTDADTDSSGSSGSEAQADTDAQDPSTTSGAIDPTSPLSPAEFGGPSTSGCHCNATGPGLPGGAALLLLLAGLTRRRRRKEHGLRLTPLE